MAAFEGIADNLGEAFHIAIVPGDIRRVNLDIEQPGR